MAALEPPPRLTLARYLLRLATGGAEGDAQLGDAGGGGDGISWGDATWEEARSSSSAAAFSTAMRAHCLGQSVTLEAYAPDGQGGSRHMHYRALEAETMFHENIFNVDCWYMYLLQFTCCVWVTTHVSFVDLLTLTLTLTLPLTR